jgi:peptide/nickel transport system substrate-binding protein
LIASALALTPSALPAQTDDERLILRIGTTTTGSSANPFAEQDPVSAEVTTLQYDMLVRPSPEDSAPVAGLASSWTTSLDETTWTFRIDPEATWSDGEPVTADDVEYTFERVMREQLAPYIDYIRHVESVEVADKSTVILRSSEPAEMLALFVPIVPEHVWEEVPIEETTTYENLPSVGSGPFEAVTVEDDGTIRMARSEFTNSATDIDQIVFRTFDTQDELATALQDGEIDYATGLGIEEFREAGAETFIRAVSAPDPGFTSLGFNLYQPNPDVIEDLNAPATSTGDPALLQERVRRAIAWAIDEDAITEAVSAGEGTAGSSLIPPPLTRYHLAIPEVERATVDIERARDLLRAAGWSDTDADGTVEKDGQELQLRLSARLESSDTVEAAELIRGSLGEAGIEVLVETVSDDRLMDDIYTADYDMFIWGWASGTDPDYLLSVLTCDQRMGRSDTFYCNDHYDRLYAEQKLEVAVPARAAIVKEMQEIVYRQTPYVVLYYDNQLEAYRTDRFTGWATSPADAEEGQVAFNGYRASYEGLSPLPGATNTNDPSSGRSLVPLVFGLIAAGVLIVSGVVLRQRT